MKFVLAAFIFTLAVVTGSRPRRNHGPAVKIKVTQDGLNHVADVAIEKATSEFLKTAPSNQTGNHSIWGNVIEYGLTDMNVTSFTKPRSRLVVNENKGITWSTTGTSASLNGRWKYNMSSINAYDEGGFDVSVTNVYFSMSASVDAGTGGRPRLSVFECNASIASLRMVPAGEGDVAVLFQFMAGLIQSYFRVQLEKYLCTFVKKYMNNDVRDKLQNMPVEVPVGNMVLDYSLTSSPKFGKNYVESELKGEFRWKDEEEGPNLTVEKLPDSTAKATPKMVYVWMSDYFVNSYLYTAHRHGLLKYTLTGADLPNDAASFLNNTCPAHKFCLGKLFPDLATKYRNGRVFVSLKAGSVPAVKVVQDGLQLMVTGALSFYARNPGQEAHRLMSLIISARTAASINIQNNNITANFSHISLRIRRIHFNNGNITQGPLLRVINTLLHSYIEPQLQALGKGGIPLPEVDVVKYINPVLEWENHNLVVGTDLNITT